MTKKSRDIKYELFRKFFHISTLCFLILYEWNFWLGFALSLLFLFIYLFSEFLRINHINYVFFTKISKIIFKSRRNNSEYIVLSPVFLVLGIFVTYLLIPYPSSYVGIISVCLGDGLASIFGKFIPSFKFPNGKTLLGSLTMFLVTAFATYYFFGNLVISLFVGLIGSIIELVSFSEFDNFSIPILIGILCVLLS